MDEYLKKHGEMCRAAAKECGIDDESELLKFQTICAFLADNPGLLSWRGKGEKPKPTTRWGIGQLAKKYFGARAKKDWPAEPTTVPDEAVSIVIRAVYGYTAAEAERIKAEHQHAMSAENIVGSLLERYIASVMEAHGWVWCAGDFVKAVDFVKQKADNAGWQAVQVKNRNNTENSSSAAIRQGTDIEKWFRSFAKKQATNWDKFPEPEFRGKLSEAGFRNFLRDYLTKQR